MKRHERIRPASKWAVCVKSHAIRSMINLAVESILTGKIRLKVFDNEMDAMAWLES